MKKMSTMDVNCRLTVKHPERSLLIIGRVMLMNPIQLEFIMPEFNFLRPFGKSKKSKRKAMRKILLIVNDLFKTENE